jgi:uncharacterized protein (TIGR02996 family)
LSGFAVPFAGNVMLEDAFIAAVLAEPEDDTPRLVYADWLEERGDPRAEFLRAECQLRKLSSTEDSFPALRTRLEQVSLTLDPDWVALVRTLPVPDAVEAALTEMEDLLPGLNYLIWLGIYRVPLTPGAAPEWYVGTALGPKTVVGHTRPVAAAELLAEVERCLRYSGNDGHGPNLSVFRSPEFNPLLRRVLGYLEQSAAQATAVASFWLQQGHPFSPVMWDFAYVFVKPQCAVVFMGASSD